MPAEGANAGDSPGIFDSGKIMANAVRDWLTGISDLATLEIRYSIEAISAALVSTLILAVVLFSSWCLILITVAVALVQSGWGWIPALLLVLVLNLLFAVVLWQWTKGFIARVGMDSTRHVLGLDNSTPNDDLTETYSNS